MGNTDPIMELDDQIRKLYPLLKEKDEKMGIILQGAINENADDETLRKITVAIKEEILLREAKKIK